MDFAVVIVRTCFVTVVIVRTCFFWEMHFMLLVLMLGSYCCWKKGVIEL